MSRKTRPANHLHPALVGAVFGGLLVFLGWLAGDPARVDGFDRLSGQVLALGAMVLLLAVILFGLALGGMLIAGLLLPAGRPPRPPRRR